MVNTMVAACDVDLAAQAPSASRPCSPATTRRAGPRDHRARGRARPRARRARCGEAAAGARACPCSASPVPAARASRSLTDELLRRFRLDQEDKLRIAVVAVDPTRRRGGGALLGDRIRMNPSHRRARCSSARWPPAAPPASCPRSLADVVARVQGGRLRPGRSSRRRASARATPRSCRCVDVSLYVMTPEFGAASQLEKIDMLDFADVVAINKFERRGAEDARRDVARQLVRNREAFGVVVGGRCRCSARARRASTTTASPRSTSTCATCSPSAGWPRARGGCRAVDRPDVDRTPTTVPPARARYLAEIAGTVRGYHARTAELADAARRRQQLDHRRRAARRAPRGAWRPSSRAPTRAADAERRRRDPRRRSRSGRESSSSTAPTSSSTPCAAARSARRCARDACRARRCRGSPCRAPQDHGDLVRVPALREPARALPVHRRGVPAEARRRGPGAHVRRRGRPGPHQPALPPARRGPAGDPALDGVRLGHAVRPRPRRAPRRLRQGRHVGRLDRHARRHEGALRRLRPVRADDVACR